MTKKNLINFLLIAICIAATFIAGCIPDDTLQWSADGSVGIYSKDGDLLLVDGDTGSLTPIAPKTTLWPAISPDGRFIAYGQQVVIENFSNALGLLPPNQIKLLQAHANAVKENILRKVSGDSSFDDILESYNPEYRSWLVHYLFEKLDDDSAVARKVGTETVEKALKEPLNYYRLILIPSDNLNKKTVIAMGIQNIWKVSFSPDANLIAYVTNRIKGDPFEFGFDLYIASPAENITAALVEQAVAIGYDFRPDSRAIAYMKPELENFDSDNFVVGSLVERIIIDPNNRLIASPADLNDNTSLATHICSGPADELAGIGYYSWMFVSYACEGRIFFSSAKISLPSSKLDDEKQTIFCYDILTGAISEILPQLAIDFTQSNCHLFRLSQDCQRILLPGDKNTLGIYALGQDLSFSKILIDEDESFGEDRPLELISRWKGRDQITCLVAENSHYLTDDPNTPHRRKEIVILDTDGKLVQILSKEWPDELLYY